MTGLGGRDQGSAPQAGGPDQGPAPDAGGRAVTGLGGRDEGPALEAGGRAGGPVTAGGPGTGRAAGIGRRRLLGYSGAALVVGAAAGAGAAAHAPGGGDAAGATAVPFFGAHQAGIATPVQDRLHFAAFDVETDDRRRLVALLREWTAAAAAFTAGRPYGSAAGGLAESPPDDTGEALGLPPSRLTLTIGFGPALFDKEGEDRFGVRVKRPPALIDLPHFPGDELDPARSGGDICVQACADDPQVAVHAIRNLARIGFGAVSVRWSQLGFGKTSSTTPDRRTPRNLFGFKDGTRNIAGTDHAALDEHVWAGPGDGPAWMSGGSYVVARRIRMHIETWDRTSIGEQQDTFGRAKGEGNPYGARREHDPVPLSALPADSHVRLAHPDTNGGAAILRRGYSFTDGTDGLGRLDAGLFFIAYQRDPRRQFVPLQTRLSGADHLNEYIQHVGSGIWACPPGVSRGGFWGDTLFT